MQLERLTQQELKNIVKYSQRTGMFTAKYDTIQREKGDLIGNLNKGTLTAYIDYKTYNLNVLAWLYVYGCYPSGRIEHINGNRTDNRINNLRLKETRISTRKSL